MAHTSPNEWPADGSLPDHVSEFVDWLIDPANVPHNKKKWAEDHGVHYVTVFRWLKDNRVTREIDKRANELNMRPDRIQGVMNSIYRAAENGDMKAAALYLQHVDRLAPRRLVIEDKRIAALSDEELQKEMAELGMLG